MASDRDTLAAVPGMVVHDDELHHAIDQSLAGLYTDWGLSEGLPAPVTVAVHIERDLRAAGWRPPARETTDPDALPPGSIVLRDGVAWHRDAGYWHLVCGGHARWDRPFGSDPITVLYVPTEENPNA